MINSCLNIQYTNRGKYNIWIRRLCDTQVTQTHCNRLRLGERKKRLDSGLMYFYLDIQLILYTHPRDKDPALGTQALLEEQHMTGKGATSQLGCFMDLLFLYPSMEDYERRTRLSPPMPPTSTDHGVKRHPTTLN